MSTPKKLGTIKKISLREAWKHEATEFTPWLAQSENLDKLADELGLAELTCVATEDYVGDFKLDILANDGTDKVIIENQLEETDHRHLGQIIAYAAGVGAKKVIWVAESFRPEHSSALQFLNENTTEEIAFFGIKIELWRIGDSEMAPKFEIIVKPDSWTKASRSSAKVASESSPTKKLQLKFWNSLVKALAKLAPNLRPHAPTACHWLTLAIGRSGFIISITANTRDERIGVEIYISDEESKSHFAALKNKEKEIESKLGFQLDWQELPDAHACRIVTWLSGATIEDETKWPKYQEWIAQRLVKIDSVFRPIIKNLP
jgi:Domain of unknown function (DUF4268)